MDQKVDVDFVEYPKLKVSDKELEFLKELAEGQPIELVKARLQLNQYEVTKLVTKLAKECENRKFTRRQYRKAMVQLEEASRLQHQQEIRDRRIDHQFYELNKSGKKARR